MAAQRETVPTENATADNIGKLSQAGKRFIRIYTFLNPILATPFVLGSKMHLWRTSLIEIKGPRD
jgi:hypothetical protein